MPSPIDSTEMSLDRRNHRCFTCVDFFVLRSSGQSQLAGAGPHMDLSRQPHEEMIALLDEKQMDRSQGLGMTHGRYMPGCMFIINMSPHKA